MADDIWGQWLERDLLQDARNGKVKAAYEVDQMVDRVVDICLAKKCPILVGESGVGKSAIIGELARQLADPTRNHTAELASLYGNMSLYQLSFRRRAVGLKKPNEEMGEEMGKLVDAILSAGNIIPYFRDIELGYQFDLEPLLESLAFRLDLPVLGEGGQKRVQRMLEYNTELEKHYVTVQVQEPNLAAASKIMDQWCDSLSTKVDAAARSQSIYLSHRFLSRSRMPQKAIDLMTQVVATTRTKSVSEGDVIARFSQTHQVPKSLIDPTVPLDLTALKQHFHESVLGQNKAVETVVDVIGLIKAGLSDPRRPFGVFLFAGPTGVGKTHLAQLLASYLFGGSERMIRINMTDFADENGADTLFGNPNANGVERQRGVLTSRVSGLPFAVLLLDEFEKAHKQVHDRLLQLIDEGEFINGLGETVSCRSMIIIATSNAGAEAYRTASFGFQNRQAGVEQKAREVERKLQELFRYELLNRFDRLVHFFPLQRDSIRRIAARELKLLGERVGLSQRRLTLSCDEAVLDWLATHGYHPNYGARFLRRTIERSIATSVAGAIVRENPPEESEIAVTVRGAKIAAYVASPSKVAAVVDGVSTVPARTREQWISDAKSLLASLEPLMNSLETVRSRRSDVLKLMGAADAWTNDDRRNNLLEEFQNLDLQVRMQENGEQAAQMLEEALSESAPTERIARRVQRLTTAKRNWEMRLAEAGPSSIWLMIGVTEATKDNSELLEKMAVAEMRWCRQLSLEVAVAGYSEENGELSRVYLDVEGPGASEFLKHERGVHRFFPGTENHAKIFVDAVPKKEKSNLGQVRSKRKRAGRLGIFVDGEASCYFEERGISRTVIGSHDVRLRRLSATLDKLETIPTEVVRIYGKDGVGARDPETGVSLMKLKDVFNGLFDRFLEARRSLTR